MKLKSKSMKQALQRERKAERLKARKTRQHELRSPRLRPEGSHA